MYWSVTTDQPINSNINGCSVLRPVRGSKSDLSNVITTGRRKSRVTSRNTSSESLPHLLRPRHHGIEAAAHANLNRSYGVKLLSRERTFCRFGGAREPWGRENFVIYPPESEALGRKDRVPRTCGTCARPVSFRMHERCNSAFIWLSSRLLLSRFVAHCQWERPIGEGAQTVVVCGPLISLW